MSEEGYGSLRGTEVRQLRERVAELEAERDKLKQLLSSCSEQLTALLKANEEHEGLAAVLERGQ